MIVAEWPMCILGPFLLKKQTIISPWVILEDFNCVANLDELIGSPIRLAEVQPLRDYMAMCGVHDLQYHGRFSLGLISKRVKIVP